MALWSARGQTVAHDDEDGGGDGHGQHRLLEHSMGQIDEARSAAAGTKGYTYGPVALASTGLAGCNYELIKMKCVKRARPAICAHIP